MVSDLRVKLENMKRVHDKTIAKTMYFDILLPTIFQVYRYQRYLQRLEMQCLISSFWTKPFNVSVALGTPPRIDVIAYVL